MFFFCLQMDWCVWPPTQLINFLYVPNHYQVVYVNAITMLYNVFLSYIKHIRGTQPSVAYVNVDKQR